MTKVYLLMFIYSLGGAIISNWAMNLNKHLIRIAEALEGKYANK